MAQGTETVTASDNVVIVDLGRHRRKQIKKLRRGENGKLLDEVTASIEELREAGTISKSAETVVFVVREKRPRRKLPGGLF